MYDSIFIRFLERTKMLDSSPVARQYLATISVCMGAVSAGTVLGWTANLAEKIKDGKYNDMKHLDDTELSWIGSCMTIGALLMCFPTGYLCNWLGRKLFMLTITIPMVCGWLCLIFAKTVELVYFGRFLTGVGGGVFCVAAPLYTSEISQPSIRGSLGNCFQLFLTVGILIVYILGAPLDPVAVSWICLVIPILFFVSFIWFPETPLYLLSKGMEDEARASLKVLRGANYAQLEQELSEMKNFVESRKSVDTSAAKELQKPEVKKALIICFALMFFQQFSGINTVIFYSGNIFKDAETSMSPESATILMGSIQVVATLVSTVTVDRFGRKILLIISDFMMAVGTFLLGIYFYLKNRDVLSSSEIKNIGWLPVLAVCLFIVVFSLGYGPIPWMIQAELLPNEVKAIAASSAGTFNWLLAFIITSAYLPVANAISNEVTFFIFTGISLVGVFFVWKFIPETKGKTFQEIMDLLSS